MKLLTAFALSLLLLAPSLARAQSEPTVDGFWEVRDKDGNPTAWFLFAEKDNVYFGRLVKGFKKPGDDKPPQTICDKCPGDKKGAHVMGLTLFWGMKRDGLHYDDGSVLDPRDGSVYHALMNLSEDGKELEVRGYLGIKMLGRSQTWYRLPDDAMKAEEIPKEILAGGEAAPAEKSKPSGKSKHGHSASGDKAKHKKPEKSKPAPAPSDTPDDNGDGADKAAQ